MAFLFIRSVASFCLLLILQSLFCVTITPSFHSSTTAAAWSSPASDAPVVRNLSDIHGDSYGRPGLSHLTVAGAVHHAMQEVELWLQTFAPGTGTPVHKHNCEEVFLILKGKGTLYLASTSDGPYPGKPDEFSIYVNSTFTIPVNAVHQIRNTYQDQDLQHLAIISRPPIKVLTYRDWYTLHVEAQEVFPYPWDADLKPSAEGDCGTSMPADFTSPVAVGEFC